MRVQLVLHGLVLRDLHIFPQLLLFLVEIDRIAGYVFDKNQTDHDRLDKPKRKSHRMNTKLK